MNIKNIYVKKVIKILIKVMVSFVVAFVLIKEEISPDMDLKMQLVLAMMCSGFLEGWQTISKITRNWTIVGSIPLMLILLAFKFVYSIVVGFYVTIGILIYNIIMAIIKRNEPFDEYYDECDG